MFDANDVYVVELKHSEQFDIKGKPIFTGSFLECLEKYSEQKHLGIPKIRHADMLAYIKENSLEHYI